MLTLSEHLEDKSSLIREVKDMITMSLDKLYGILQIYERKIERRKNLGIKNSITKSNTLVATKPKEVEVKVKRPQS